MTSTGGGQALSAAAPVPAQRGRHRLAASPALGRRATLRVGRWQVHYQVAGEQHGEAVVLVHGLAASYRWWERTVPALAGRYRVYAVDLPGFGHTRPRRRFLFAHAVEMLATWMAALDMPHAALVGHSMGGHVCIRLTARYPHLARRLVLVNASGLPLQRPWPLLLARALQAGLMEPPSFSWRMMSSSLRAGPLVLASAALAVLADDVRDDLARIGVPTLVIWGERDRLVPLALGQALVAAIPGAQLSVIKGAGHKAMIECPQEFNGLLLDFLRHT